MNGLSVMPCVQSVQAGSLSGYSVYGLSARRSGQKMIRISQQAKAGQERKADRFDRFERSERFGSGESISNRTGAARFNKSASISLTADPEQGLKAKIVRDKKNFTGSDRTAHRNTAPAPLALRVLILAVLFAGMIAGFQTMTGASSRAKEQTYKYYTTVTIGYGEDITDIVYRYCDSSEYSTPDAYIREICEINSLPYHKGTVPDLSAGTQIVIPYFDTELK